MERKKQVWICWQEKGYLKGGWEEKLEKQLLREEKFGSLIEEAKAKKQNASSKKKKIEVLDWCLNTIEENNGDWEKLAVKAMEEIEEEKLMKEIAKC